MKIEFQKKELLDSKLWFFALILFLGYFLASYAYVLPVDFIVSTDEGDFGRDLYYFYLTSIGQLPYTDYNWIYGPLSPLLYGSVFKVFGVSVFNALSLWYMCFIISVFLMFYAVKQFLNNACAFLAGVIFIVYYEGLMIQVFNHIFGAVFILITIILLKHYLDNSNKKMLYFMGFTCFLLMICKLNIGVAFFFSIFFALAVLAYINKDSVKDIISPVLISIILTAGFYALFMFRMPFKDLSKSFPYSSNNLAKYSSSLLESLISSDYSFMSSYWNVTIPDNLTLYLYHWANINIWYFVIILIAIILSVFIYKKEKSVNADLKYLSILSLSAMALSHEYICIYSMYSLKFWGLPVLTVLFFYINYCILKYFKLNKVLKTAYLLILLVAFAGLSVNTYIMFLVKPSPQTSLFVKLDRMKISVNHYCWYVVMNEAVEYIIKSTTLDEKIFILPNNMYYHFVTGRQAPSRYKEFLPISGITPQDEQIVISDIEKNRVNLILYAYKMEPDKYGFGGIGKVYLKTLDKYIIDNYEFNRAFCCELKTGITCPLAFYKRKTPFK